MSSDGRNRALSEMDTSTALLEPVIPLATDPHEFLAAEKRSRRMLSKFGVSVSSRKEKEKYDISYHSSVRQRVALNGTCSTKRTRISSPVCINKIKRKQNLGVNTKALERKTWKKSQYGTGLKQHTRTTMRKKSAFCILKPSLDLKLVHPP